MSASESPSEADSAPLSARASEEGAQLRDDLGIGRLASERSGRRFLNRDGSFTTRREGLGGLASFSPFYWMLSVRWQVFFGVAALAFLCINLIFAGLYLLCGPDALSSATRLSRFERAFFFSVETLSTIGYGHIVPNNLAAHWLSTLEAFTGVLSVALITGLLFAKFSKPAARILFSEYALVAPFQGGTGLMLRLTNGLRNEIIEIGAQLTLARFETIGGQRVRRFYALTLERSSVAFFNLSWTVVHPITADSPLWGVTPEAFLASEAEILVVLQGVDDILFQRVHARSSYRAEDVIWNAKFSDLYLRRSDGSIAIDARRLSAFERLE